jgi:hypothetical protein
MGLHLARSRLSRLTMPPPAAPKILYRPAIRAALAARKLSGVAPIAQQIVHSAAVNPSAPTPADSNSRGWSRVVSLPP